MRVTVARALDLDAAATAGWARMQEARPELSSPFFRPEFTAAVAAVRDDVFVGLLETDGQLGGFFPFQRNRVGLGLPVGGRRSNHHGVIADPGLGWGAVDLVRGCRLRAFDFDHILASQAPFRPHHTARSGSSVIDLSDGFDGYVADRRSAGSNVVARTEQQIRRLERELGPVRFEAESHDRGLLALLMRWKSEQYRSTGRVDRFAAAWNVRLLERIHETRCPGFAGTLSVLRAGDRVAALAFGMRTRDTWHYWFPAYDRELGTYSPGLGLLLRIIEEAGSRRIATIDLGKHDEPYKTRFRTGSIDVAEGRVVALII